MIERGLRYAGLAMTSKLLEVAQNTPAADSTAPNSSLSSTQNRLHEWDPRGEQRPERKAEKVAA